jgi:hypothetical protein
LSWLVCTIGSSLRSLRRERSGGSRLLRGKRAPAPQPSGNNEQGSTESGRRASCDFLLPFAWDVKPSLVEGIGSPVHTLAITALGLDIIDNLDLEAVAEAAAKSNRWEFLLVVAPVPVTGGTGFPVNPLATF